MLNAWVWSAALSAIWFSFMTIMKDFNLAIENDGQLRLFAFYPPYTRAAIIAAVVGGAVLVGKGMRKSGMAIMLAGFLGLAVLGVQHVQQTGAAWRELADHGTATFLQRYLAILAGVYGSLVTAAVFSFVLFLRIPPRPEAAEGWTECRGQSNWDGALPTLGLAALPFFFVVPAFLSRPDIAFLFSLAWIPILTQLLSIVEQQTAIVRYNDRGIWRENPWSHRNAGILWPDVMSAEKSSLSLGGKRRHGAMFRTRIGWKVQVRGQGFNQITIRTCYCDNEPGAIALYVKAGTIAAEREKKEAAAGA